MKAEQTRVEAIAELIRDYPLNTYRDALVGVILSRWPDASGEEIQRRIASAAEERGDLEKGKTLRAEAQTLLERSRKRLGLKRIAGNVQHLATIAVPGSDR